MSPARDELIVHLDASDLEPAGPVGTLRRARAGATIDLSFEYSAGWLASERRFTLDPAFELYAGEQRPPRGRLAGIFADTAPDRWGRVLLERREAVAARREGRKARTLDDWDFLTGVSDELRMGALRLARPDDGVFVAPGAPVVPPLARLRTLQYLAEQVERGVQLSSREEDDEVALLLAPGSSLGGARPKANFRADDGSLWIAKFPSREDRRDVGAWEHVLAKLAETVGIAMPETQLLHVAGPHRTFCARRFDRAEHGRRLFASAMTLLEKRDGDPASYLEIVEAIERYGDPSAIEADLEQLFRRALFNVLVAHRDDHPRNHGFLRVPGGWRLAPAFDVNPMPEKVEHTLSFDDAIRAPDLDLVRETAPFYRLAMERADAIMDQIRAGVSRWREVAQASGLPRDGIELMAPAFEQEVARRS